MSVMDEAAFFQFGKWINYSKPQPGVKIIPLKGAWYGSRDPFKIFLTFSIFLEWMKLHSLKLASGSTTASLTQG